jgi:hypothetical protein
MEVKLKELFGEDMHETGRQGGEITFSKFLKVSHAVRYTISSTLSYLASLSVHVSVCVCVSVSIPVFVPVSLFVPVSVSVCGQAVEKVQMHTFLNTTKGRLATQNGKAGKNHNKH